MSENAEDTTLNQLTLFAEDFRASHLVLPGSYEAMMMTATSGRNLSALLGRQDPVGLWLKMCLEYELFTSTQCYLTWRGWSTPQKRSLYRLLPSTPPTEGTGSGLWRTPHASDGEGGIMEMRPETTGHYKLRDNVHPKNKRFWPTPKKIRSGPDYARMNRSKSGGDDLVTAVARTMYPTPDTRDWKSGKGYDHVDKKNTPQLRHLSGGLLNPTWVEWLMGFPVGWTDLEPSEMQ